MKRSLRRRLFALWMAALSASAVSCDDDGDDNGSTAPSGEVVGTPNVLNSDAGAHGGLDGGALANLTNEQIAAVVSAANTGQVSQAALALYRGANEDALQFARQMIEDHGGAQEQLGILLTARSQYPDENRVSEAVVRELDQINARIQCLSDQDFDLAYMAGQVAIHRRVLQILDDQLIPSADDQTVSRALTAVRSVLEQHYEKAQAVLAQLAGDGGLPPGLWDGGVGPQDAGTTDGGVATTCPDGEDADAGTAGADAGVADLSDAQILTILSLVNVGEAESGMLALANADASSVKQFGGRMIEDHVAAQDREGKLRRDLDLAPEESVISAQVRAQARKLIERLRPLTGEAFDEEYLQTQVSVHQLVFTLLDTEYIDAADSRRVRDELEAVRDVIADHLERARTLSAGGDAGAADAGPGLSESRR